MFVAHLLTVIHRANALPRLVDVVQIEHVEILEIITRIHPIVHNQFAQLEYGHLKQAREMTSSSWDTSQSLNNRTDSGFAGLL